MLDYKGKLALAPMVRISELPTRLLSLRYGADLVWGPEIVDKKLIQCTRSYNEKLDCIDFKENINPNRLVFRTFPKIEKSKLVFQMGTACPDLAVQAGRVIANDVDAIDVNSGCPMQFSTHSGMGAALLKTPDKLINILTSLVEQVGEPYGISISVKIRLLDPSDPEQTYALVRRLVKTGINCLTLHCRTTPMRPREPVIRDALKGVVDICHEAGVACYVNGDVTGRADLQNLIENYNVDGAMIARAAEANPSVFSIYPPKAWQDIVKEYVQLCYEFDNNYVNAKYCLSQMIPTKHSSYQHITRAKSLDTIQQVIDEIELPGNNKKRTNEYMHKKEPPVKRQEVAT